MKRITVTHSILFAILMAATGSATTPLSIEVTRNLTSMPLAFTENQGQWDEQVSFRANAGGATMWFTSDGAVYQFTRRVGGAREARETGLPVTPNGLEGRLQSGSIESIAIKASFIGANTNPRLLGMDAIEYRCNYFIGDDPNEWHTDVPNYSAIAYEDIYSGIDLKYYGNGKQMEYDFIVSPGADFSQIRIRYEGAESISINDHGELVVTTKWGEVIERRPVIYQTDSGFRIPVAGIYTLRGDKSFGFEISSYNPDLPLIIDPVLSYSTYLGGSGSDPAIDIAVDGSGNAYITGWTNSTDFPTVGAFEDTFQGGYEDVFVTKLNSSGSGLVYSTYLGGSAGDGPGGIAVNASGNAYIAGTTWSSDFPTVGEFQPDQFYVDAFVTKLSPAGNTLVYSTYLGGDGVDYGNTIAVGAAGRAYIGGYTESEDFPTQNPFQANRNGQTDAFVTKLNGSGAALVYSTYLGGSFSEEVLSIAVEPGTGKAYVTGATSSTDFPTMNPFLATYQGGSRDVFVAKLISTGDSLIYSTYLGGDATEYGRGITVDGFGGAYITGYTSSTDFPVKNAYQATLSDSTNYDAFVTKLKGTGGALSYSTYLGGSLKDYGQSIAIDGSGNTYISGYTLSADFPTQFAYQDTYQGGGVNFLGDAFVTKLNGSGANLVYSTYFGGTHDDGATGIAVDDTGNVYICGTTFSTNFPTEGAYQGYLGFYNQDAFVAKISEANDLDNDWIADGDDNCPNDYNPDQADADSNGVGDVCDGCCVSPIRGNVDSDAGDIIDISDLVYLVDYMFTGGPNPTCWSECNVDAVGPDDNSGIDISDLVFLVDYMFTGGPPPVACP